ncbi:MAG TPA: hypothetical protein VMW09_03230 [Desulfatiglandales bacterium]|nr:hypothetical protein [Desulfatiglandales bacterium]
MAKKRKEVDKINIVVEVTEEEAKPKCFGNKESYCRKELCGKWFDMCVCGVKCSFLEE